MARQPESRDVKRYLEYLREKGGRWIKIHGGDNPFQEVGLPDILGCYHGRAVAIEAKTPAGQLSVKQRLFLKEWGEAGGYSLIATSLASVRRFIANIDKEVEASS
jgi:hypothetical protein